MNRSSMSSRMSIGGEGEATQYWRDVMEEEDPQMNRLFLELDRKGVDTRTLPQYDLTPAPSTPESEVYLDIDVTKTMEQWAIESEIKNGGRGCRGKAGFGEYPGICRGRTRVLTSQPAMNVSYMTNRGEITTSSLFEAPSENSSQQDVIAEFIILKKGWREHPGQSLIIDTKFNKICDLIEDWSNDDDESCNIRYWDFASVSSKNIDEDLEEGLLVDNPPATSLRSDQWERVFGNPRDMMKVDLVIVEGELMRIIMTVSDHEQRSCLARGYCVIMYEWFGIGAVGALIAQTKSLTGFIGKKEYCYGSDRNDIVATMIHTYSKSIALQRLWKEWFEFAQMFRKEVLGTKSYNNKFCAVHGKNCAGSSSGRYRDPPTDGRASMW